MISENSLTQFMQDGLLYIPPMISNRSIKLFSFIVYYIFFINNILVEKEKYHES